LKRKMDDLYIVGTDTGVGKTVLSLLLMQFFYSKEFTPFYLKPAQTGCQNPYDTDSDANFIYQHVKPLGRKDPADSVIYCFKNPKAPYFAARNEGKEIDFRIIQEVIDKKRTLYSPIIIEAAGGLFVPVNKELLIIDTIRVTKARPIIASRAGLGTINHTLLTVEALKGRGIQPAGIVLIDSGDKNTPEDMIGENIEAIEKISGIEVAGVIGKIVDFSNPDRDCFLTLERLFETFA